MRSLRHRQSAGRGLPPRSRRHPACWALCLLLLALPAAAQDLVETGVYVGNGSGSHPIAGLSFEPDVVIVKGALAEPALLRTSTMAVSHCVSLADGSQYIGSGILKSTADGFTVGANSAVNEPGVEYHWIALKAEAGSLEVGTYTGTGLDNHTINVGLHPSAVLVCGENGLVPYFRQVDEGFGWSVPLVGGGETWGRIDAFDDGWFRVDNSAEVNEGGETYHYVAWDNTDARIDSGSYTGNAADNRSIAGLGFAPGFVLVKSAAAWDVQVRGASLPVDSSLVVTADGTAANRLQDFGSDGFTVGSDPTVNGFGQTFYWLAGAGVALEADLQVQVAAAGDTAYVGSLLEFEITIANNGPDAVDGIVVQAPIPAAATFESATTAAGDYDSPSGVWTVGAMNAGDTLTMTLVVSVDAGSAGSDVACATRIDGAHLTDSDPANNEDEATVAIVASADLAVEFTVDESAPDMGDTLAYTVILKNYGPDGAPAVEIRVDMLAGLDYLDASATAGAFVPGDQTWYLGDLAAGGTDTLHVRVQVAEGQGGLVKNPTAAVAYDGPYDPVTANDTASVTIEIQGVWQPDVVLEVFPGAAITTSQNVADLVVLNFSLANQGTAPDTLRSLTLTNAATGRGTQAQLDSMWRELSLLRALDAIDLEEHAKGGLISAVFVDGEAVFQDLNWILAPGRTIECVVRSAPSSEAPDGYAMSIEIAAAEDVELAVSSVQAPSWPLPSGIDLTIDGFGVDAVGLLPLDSGSFAVGSINNQVLGIHLPSNGFLADTLLRLNVVNYGSAQAGSDIDRLEAWADADGDGAFDPLYDQTLGTFVFTGDRWELTGLSTPVAPGGLDVFVSADITETADEAATAIRLGLPGPPDYGVGMASNNDGPVDGDLIGEASFSISGEDRIVLRQEWIHPAVVFPGAGDLSLLHVTATNSYADDRVLRSLAVTNTTLGDDGATQAQLDATCRQVVLRHDKDGLGLDDEQTDPVLGNGPFESGRLLFDGLELTLPAGATTHLFVTADLGLMTVADGDRISAEIASISDVEVENSTIVATWPVDSGARWTVDGMIAAQIETRPISVFTLGPDDGPALALDLTVPANGYLADQLLGISLWNDAGLGAAGAGDLAQVALWIDDGDGVFATATDTLLAPMTLQGANWVSPVLNRAIPAQGLRLFAGVTVSSTPQDSSTVRFVVPTGGILTSSGNSGPLDHASSESGTLVLSTSPLLSSLAYVSTQVNVGQSGEVQMTVVNRGGEQVNAVAPSLAQIAGTAPVALGSPTPASSDLLPGATVVFSWPLTASAAGIAVLEGGASGTGNDTGLLRRSVLTPTSSLRVTTPVPRLDLYPVTNLPFSINRGQSGVVPLTLTLSNPGDVDVADARLDAIRVVLRETPTGAMIAPADLLSRIIVNEGTDLYANTTSLPGTAASFEIPFDQPAVVTGDEPVTLAVRFDLRSDSTAPSFVLSIEDANWFAATDAVGGQDVPLELPGGAFPVQSGQGNLVTQASALQVALVDQDPSYAGPGQTGVVLAGLELTNASIDGTSSSIELGSVAFALRDESGERLADPALVFDSLALATSFQGHFSGAVSANQDSLVILQLSPPVLVPGGATLTLRLTGDIAATPPFGPVRVEVGSTSLFDARDANTGAAIGVSLTSGALGAEIGILGAAETVNLAGLARLPEAVPQGAAGIDALRLTIRHPGETGTAPIAVDTLRVDFFDNQRVALDPSAYLDALRVLAGGAELAEIGRPSAADGVVTVPIPAVTLEPGQSATLDLQFDIRPDAPARTLEMSLAGDGLFAHDEVRSAPVAVVADNGGSLPLTSGTTRIILAADELIVAANNRLPAILAPQAEAFPVLALGLANPADVASGAVEVHELTFHQCASATARLGRVAALARLTSAGEVWAEAELATDATSFLLAGSEPLRIAAGEELEVILEIELRSDPPGGTVALELSAEDILARPADATTTTVFVAAASGQSFPLQSAAATLSAADLAGSYANFPNPFQAGREATTFVYSLPDDATVTLRLLTPHGESVATLLDHVPVAAGLRQTDQWDGRNGNGKTVRNGVYIAELTAEFADGRSERVLRKVAVVR